MGLCGNLINLVKAFSKISLCTCHSLQTGCEGAFLLSELASKTHQVTNRMHQSEVVIELAYKVLLKNVYHKIWYPNLFYSSIETGFHVFKCSSIFVI